MSYLYTGNQKAPYSDIDPYIILYFIEMFILGKH